jgi:hypothetical protein
MKLTPKRIFDFRFSICFCHLKLDVNVFYSLIESIQQTREAGDSVKPRVKSLATSAGDRTTEIFKPMKWAADVYFSFVMN